MGQDGMSLKHLFGAMIASTLVAASGAACAQQAMFTPISDTSGVREAFGVQSAASSPMSGRRTLEWDPRRGRWGLSLGLQQRSDDRSTVSDVEPGLYYKVTPRLHIGGAVSLSNSDTGQPPLRLDPQPAVPRVRLETTFKF